MGGYFPVRFFCTQKTPNYPNCSNNCPPRIRKKKNSKNPKNPQNPKKCFFSFFAFCCFLHILCPYLFIFCIISSFFHLLKMLYKNYGLLLKSNFQNRIRSIWLIWIILSKNFTPLSVLQSIWGKCISGFAQCRRERKFHIVFVSKWHKRNLTVWWNNTCKKNFFFQIKVIFSRIKHIYQMNLRGSSKNFFEIFVCGFGDHINSWKTDKYLEKTSKYTRSR